MLIYVALVCTVYLGAVIGDYLTTTRQVREGGEEVNPLFRGRPVRRLLDPFLYATPLVALASAAEFHFLSVGEYDRAGGLLYDADAPAARLASLAVFAALAVSAHKIVASLSNLAVMALGSGLPDLVYRVLPRMPRRIEFLAVVLASLVLVLPLLVLLRSMTRTVVG